MTKLTSAVSKGVGALKSAAGRAADAVFDIIKKLPGRLLSLGGSLLNSGRTLGSKIIDGLRSGLQGVGDMLGNVSQAIKGALNRAIGLPKHVKFSVMGKGFGFTIPEFARGGITPGGPVLVGEEGPELVDLPRGSRVHSASRTRSMARSPQAMGYGLPERVILRIGDRDFLAYVESIADDRIAAADELAYQGA